MSVCVENIVPPAPLATGVPGTRGEDAAWSPKGNKCQSSLPVPFTEPPGVAVCRSVQAEIILLEDRAMGRVLLRFMHVMLVFRCLHRAQNKHIFSHHPWLHIQFSSAVISLSFPARPLSYSSSSRYTQRAHTHTNTQTYSCSTVSVHTAHTPGVPVQVLSRRLQSGWPSTELFSRENRTDINRLLMGFITSKDAVTQSHLIVVYIVIAGSFSELNMSQRGCCHFGQKKFHVRVPTFYERR